MADCSVTRFLLFFPGYANKQRQEEWNEEREEESEV